LNSIIALPLKLNNNNLSSNGISYPVAPGSSPLLTDIQSASKTRRVRSPTAGLGLCRPPRQPHNVIGEYPASEPRVSGKRLLLAQGLPEKLPVYFRARHIVADAKCNYCRLSGGKSGYLPLALRR
jgi:hypothetical protein